ncbi:FAD-dependent oxidoreductase [Spirillospora sp. NPDC029432]|uniref:NAD(P)/FAD-dependent oxidoreductase n=1 Tax=Spirillospora sp. NPDC029432 TaxID=3154599 RepID=UPI003454229C
MATAGRIVVVGAGLAGLRTVERLRRRGHEGPVTLAGAEPHRPYDRPPLSKALLAGDGTPEPVPLRTSPYEDLGIDLRTGVRATALDTAAKQVALDGGEALPYDRLVIATGVRPRTIPAIAGPGVHVLRTFEDCLALRAGLRAARHVTVIGGGVLGCEIAAAARARGVEVALVEALDAPLARVLGPPAAAAVADLHRSNDVRLHCPARVESADNGRVMLSTGEAIATDLIVVAVGAVPDTAWLEGSGVLLDDGVVCDRTGRTSAPDVFAVGDVARMPHPYRERTVRLEHWTSAGDTAALVAGNLLAPPDGQKELAEVPYFWSDQYGVKIQCLGLPDPADELTVAAGSPESGSWLGLYSDAGGRLTGAVAFGMPAALARTRRPIAARAPLSEMMERS